MISLTTCPITRKEPTPQCSVLYEQLVAQQYEESNALNLAATLEIDAGAGDPGTSGFPRVALFDPDAQVFSENHTGFTVEGLVASKTSILLKGENHGCCVQRP